MSRELLVLRHAKSAWDTDAPSDFDRPLAKRGRKAAPRMGRWIRDRGLQPDLVVASTALRVRQTVHRLLPELEAEPECFWADGIYCASLGALMSVLAACPDRPPRVLLVGHNPGLEMLVEHLTGAAEPFPTAALAQISMPDDWSDLKARCASLVQLVRPRDLDE
ncbi:MAG: SixA phosphatase family protein [Planctomycetota bacterium]